MRLSFVAVLSIFLFISVARAMNGDGALCTADDPCRAKGAFTKASAGPSKSDSIRVNPAAVPVEKITGVETLYFKNSFDFGLVKGLGRVGAAISPSNSEETFFGAPAVESDADFFKRMVNRDKLATSKYTVAAAFNLFSNHGSGLANFSVDVGVMGRYFTTTNHLTPGAGLTLTTGPLLAGLSYYQDENQTGNPPNQGSAWVQSPVKTWNAGFTLESFLLDYSVIETAGLQPAKASVLTLTSFLGRRSIMTLARREVVSDKPTFDFPTQLLVTQQNKVEWFAGYQYRVAPFLVLGAFYNYYLLHELSLGVTLFF